MAEIEHFCDPVLKDHPKFVDVEDYEMILYSACNQMDGKSAERITIGEAVKTGLVANQTLGYFMARIQKFLIKVGILPERLRFRQHMNNEMAHYACDCWDAECLTSYGWIECVGCADRSAYDLTQHSNATGVRLAAEKKLPEPKTIEVTEAVPNKQVLGKAFKKDAKSITDLLTKLSINDIETMDQELTANDSYKLHLNSDVTVTLNREMVAVKKTLKTVHVEEIIPSVIEPSFGIGRIMYSLLEHRFQMREGDEQRCFFSLPSVVAPLKCSVLPLSNNQEFAPYIKQICELNFLKLEIFCLIYDFFSNCFDSFGCFA